MHPRSLLDPMRRSVGYSARLKMGSIQGIEVSRTASSMSNLLFAYDTFIFCQARLKALSYIRGILAASERASRLKVNTHKLAIVFSWNVDEILWMELASILRVSMVPKHEKYLGLPTIAECLKELFEGIKDRIWGKLHSWSGKKLSQEGRAVLLKLVLKTLPTYFMSCFRLPNSFLRELESIITNYFWKRG
ncbi:UNVERIFIED_CONTAM: hypothetical protein Sradi_4424500 [Sesamum radiatum]|uniref:Reverse transcriptase n=1 Tax=Sesamum radiatum TaxID=300843 RepID=A0AAW2NPY7_SESRA